MRKLLWVLKYFENLVIVKQKFSAAVIPACAEWDLQAEAVCTGTGYSQSNPVAKFSAAKKILSFLLKRLI